MENVLITGASRGIGKETARLFAKEGFNVFINYNKSEEEALSLAKEINGTAVKADVSNSSEVRKMTEAIGNVDILINNAGISGFYMLDAMTDDEWKRMIDVNLTGVFNCTREVLPGMISRKRGSIVNVSSIWGICGAACEVAYSASKAGVIGFTKALAKEVGPSGICVNCVAPGVIDTDMNKNIDKSVIDELCEETPLGRMGTAEEVAKVIYFMSRHDTFVTGQIISSNGGYMV